jgi:hypothetical protein
VKLHQAALELKVCYLIVPPQRISNPAAQSEKTAGGGRVAKV